MLLKSLGLRVSGFLSLGLSLNVYAQTEVVKSVESQKSVETTASAQATTPSPAGRYRNASESSSSRRKKTVCQLLGRDLKVEPQHDPGPGDNGG